jgi:adenosylhomocysteinase
MGAHVIVTEVNPVKALEAVMDGFEVKSMTKASAIGDIFVTLTGNASVIRKEHMLKMKNNAVLANSGHFNVRVHSSKWKKTLPSNRRKTSKSRFSRRTSLGSYGYVLCKSSLMRRTRDQN